MRLVLLLLLIIGASAAAQDRPNVLFIAVDGLRPELGAYGNAVIHRPNIDAWRSQARRPARIPDSVMLRSRGAD